MITTCGEVPSSRITDATFASASTMPAATGYATYTERGSIQRGEQSPAVVQVADQGLHPGFAQPLGAVVVGAHQRPHEPPRRLQPLDHPGSGAAMAARRSDDQHRFLIACRRSHAGTLLPESGFKTQGRTGWVALSNSATMGS